MNSYSAQSGAVADVPSELQQKDVGGLGRLAPFLRPHALRVALVLLVLLSAAMVTLALPVAVKGLIDEGILAAADSVPSATNFLLLALLTTAVATLSAMRYYMVTGLGERVVADIRQKAYSRLLRLGPVFFDANGTGAILARLNSDTTLVHGVVGSSISIAMRSAIVLLGSVAMMFVTSPRLGAGMVLLVPLVVWPMVVYGRKVRAKSRQTQDLIAEAAGFADETLNGIETVQSFNLESYADGKFAAVIESSWRAAMARTIARALLTGTVIFMVFTGLVFILWRGAVDVSGGLLTPGELGQFVLYGIMAAGAAAGIGEVWGEIQRAAGAAARLADIIESEDSVWLPPEPQELPARSSDEGMSVLMRDLRFAYPARPEQTVLSDFSLEVEAGKTVAIVGRSGAGKSTLFSLLLLFHRPAAGNIFLDGVDTALCSPEEVRKRTGFVPQQTVLFAGSVLENIKLGRPGATDEEARRAAEVAHVAEFVESLPKGYDTGIGERGVRLSMGQRQRIAIARAVLKDPPLLLLDEATSALDAESERYVQDALSAMARSRTCIIIAHRLATVRQADSIVVMDGGRIAERGTHQQLVDASDVYRRFVELQLR